MPSVYASSNCIGMPKRDGRHDRELVRGVDALDVERRIGLGVAARLRLRQHVGEASRPVARISDRMKLLRAVDDAGDPLDAVGGQPFAQRLDDRDAAGDRRLERDHHALRLRGREDLVAVLREQRLVGGDDVLAVARSPSSTSSRAMLGAADQLDDDVDVRMAHDDCVGSSSR